MDREEGKTKARNTRAEGHILASLYFIGHLCSMGLKLTFHYEAHLFTSTPTGVLVLLPPWLPAVQPLIMHWCLSAGYFNAGLSWRNSEIDRGRETKT